MQTKSGFIAIVGRPNVGKSSLMNALVGEKIAIVSDKPQTTRNRITGVLTRGETQLVFLDTPGVHKSRTKLGDYMNRQVTSSVADVDLIVFVTEANRPLNEAEKKLIASFRGMPAVAVLNKIDLLDAPEEMLRKIAEVAGAYEFDEIVPVSVLKNDGLDGLLEILLRYAEEGPHFFEDDAMTDQPERVIVAEIIREKILRNMRDEIPHGTAVTIERMQDRGRIIDIDAVIYCERETHKGMLIGMMNMPVVAAAGLKGDIGNAHLAGGNGRQIALTAEILRIGVIGSADGEDHFLLMGFPSGFSGGSIVLPDLQGHAESSPGLGPAGIESGMGEDLGDLSAGDAVLVGGFQMVAEGGVHQALGHQGDHRYQRTVPQREQGFPAPYLTEQNIVIEPGKFRGKGAQCIPTSSLFYSHCDHRFLSHAWVGSKRQSISAQNGSQARFLFQPVRQIIQPVDPQFIRMEIFQQLLPVRLEELPPGSRIAILPVLQEFLRGLIGAAGIEQDHPDLLQGIGTGSHLRCSFQCVRLYYRKEVHLLQILIYLRKLCLTGIE